MGHYRRRYLGDGQYEGDVYGVVPPYKVKEDEVKEDISESDSDSEQSEETK